MRTADGPFPMETYVRPGRWLGTAELRMSFRNRGEPSGFSTVAALR